MNRDRLVLGLLAVLLLLSAWPFFEFLDDQPATSDSVIWMMRATPSSKGWAGWSFAHTHFNIGFRPVMALTFALNWVLAGLEHVWLYRLTDLLFHLAAIGATFAAARRFVPADPRPALLAAAFFGLHPLGQTIPIALEYRGYSLSVALALGAVALAEPGSTARRGLLVGCMLAAALLANETTVIFALLVPVALCVGSDDARQTLREHRAFGATAVAPVVLAIVWRTAVVRGLGGYAQPTGQRVERFATILTTVANRLVDGQHLFSATSGGLTFALLALACAWGVWRLLEGWMQGRRVPAAVVGSFVVLLLFVSVHGVFFRRMYYPLLPMAGLALAVLVDARERNLPMAWLGAVAITVGAVHDSHVAHGVDAEMRELRAGHDGWMDELAGHAAGLEAPATVSTAIVIRRGTDVLNPLRAGARDPNAVPVKYRSAVRWLDATAPEGISIEPLVWLDEARPDVAFIDGELHLAARQDHYGADEPRKPIEAATVRRYTPKGEGSRWLYLPVRRGEAMELVAVP